MPIWTEIHWSEGMFLRPHHLQSSQRWLETVIRAAFDAARPFGWGFVTLRVAREPLENFVFRLDECEARLKDGTWIRIPENTDVAPLNFKELMDRGQNAVDVYLGVPQMQDVRPNSVSIEQPDRLDGSPRYEPLPLVRRDENTGMNPQTLYVRRMRGRLFAGGQDTTGYEVLRIGRVKRTDKPGATPELDENGVGALLAVQASSQLSGLITSLADQVEAKGDVLAREAREHRMLFTDGVAANTEHLLKLHVLNEVRAGLKALLQSSMLHPYDVFVQFCRLIGHLSIFHEDLVPGTMPAYDHDHAGDTFDQLRRRIILLLDAMRPMAYVERPFTRKKDRQGRDGLEVELDRKWIDEHLDLFIALHAEDKEIDELERYVYGTLNMKLASPSRSARIANLAVRGLRLQARSVPAGTLPRRPGLHYFKVDKAIGPDRTDYWKECEQERGIRMTLVEGQLAAMENYRPTLYVPLKTP